MKIEVGHLDGGRAEIYSTVPVFGTLAPFVPGQQVEVDLLPRRQAAGQPQGGGQQGQAAPAASSSSVIVREDGKYAVSATHEATPELGADSTVRKSWKVSFPSLHQGECGEVVVGFKKAMRKMGYIANSGRASAARPPAACSPTAKSTT